jgi:ribosomal subunit interface protein
MHIVISGKHLSVGESLKSHASDFLQKHIKKYFSNAVNAHVTISKNSDEFHTNVMVNDGVVSHMTVNSDAHDSDAYKCVEKAVKKVEKQLERYKNRIKNHRKTKYNDIALEARKYIINDFSDDGDLAKADDSDYGPTVVAEKPVTLKVLSVRDAVMHMNLQSVPAMTFVNASNYKLSLVYQRADGNIAWVDTRVDMSQHVTKSE